MCTVRRGRRPGSLRRRRRLAPQQHLLDGCIRTTQQLGTVCATGVAERGRLLLCIGGCPLRRLIDGNSSRQRINERRPGGHAVSKASFHIRSE